MDFAHENKQDAEYEQRDSDRASEVRASSNGESLSNEITVRLNPPSGSIPGENSVPGNSSGGETEVQASPVYGDISAENGRQTPVSAASGLPQASPSQQPAQRPGWLLRPLPLWLYIGGIVLVVALLIVLSQTGSDWADGAAKAGNAALIIGILLVIVWFFRTRGRVRISAGAIRRAISVLCLLLLFVYYIATQASQTNLHLSQGKSLENQQRWQAAIQEYQLGEEQAPDGADLARTYASWGLALNKTQQYNAALSKFATVMNQFDEVADQVQRAQAGDLVARIALARQSFQARNYDQATKSFDSILNLDYCDTACKTQVQPLDATAYYDLGVTNLQFKNYQGAVTAFDTVLSNFSDTPAAKTQELHTNMAQALLGLGEQTRATSCSDALSSYQELAQHYSDTPEGKKARAEMNKPQDVSGTFSNSGSITFTQIALVKGLSGGMSQDEEFSAWDNASHKVGIQGNGKFAFHNIPQGDYDLLWYANDGTTEYVDFKYDMMTLAPVYTAEVGPLCPVALGTIDA